MKKFLTILLFLCPVFFLCAQSKYVVSERVARLKQELAAAKDDPTKQAVLNDIFCAYLYSYPDSCVTYAQQEILLARQMKSDLELAEGYVDYADFFYIIGDYPEALRFSLEALKLAEKSKSLLTIGRAYINMADVYYDEGDYENSRLISSKAKALMEHHWPSLKNLNTAGREINGDTVWTYLFILSRLESAYEKSDRLDSAFKYLKIANDAVIRLTGKMDNAAVLSKFGDVYSKKGDYSTALQYYHSGISLATDQGVNTDIMKNCIGIANTFKKMGEFDSGIFYANKVLNLSKSAYNSLIKLNALNLLAGLYKSKHNTDSIAKYFELIIATNDSLFSQKKNIQLQALAFDEQRRQQEQAQQQQQLQNKVKFYSLLAALAVLLLLAFLLYRNNRHKLQRKTTELKMQALRAQMNPHFIFNSLSSIDRFILQNNRAKASEYLSKFSRLVRLILQNSQASLITLESELESLGLYLEMEALRFDDHFAYKISFPNDLDTEVQKVPPLIIQPYAENAIWHGLMHKKEKGHLEIEIYQQDDHVLCCKITDDGIGRKKAAELKSKSASGHKSMGMRITADRIAILQQKKQLGTAIKITDLTLPDGSAGGTEVLLKIPVLYD